MQGELSAGASRLETSWVAASRLKTSWTSAWPLLGSRKAASRPSPAALSSDRPSLMDRRRARMSGSAGSGTLDGLWTAQENLAERTRRRGGRVRGESRRAALLRRRGDCTRMHEQTDSSGLLVGPGPPSPPGPGCSAWTGSCCNRSSARDPSITSVLRGPPCLKVAPNMVVMRPSRCFILSTNLLSAEHALAPPTPVSATSPAWVIGPWRE
mmetsp:Transcript_106027/g.337704  ORF Transcript_106027/g.337704 Transcript_106027/m.337704 type:complete len:211 (+) Transcript_106027:1133-1765(+)